MSDVEQNGDRKAQLRFGDGPGMIVRHEWGEGMLKWLWVHEPEAARAALCHVMGLPIPAKSGRPRKVPA